MNRINFLYLFPPTFPTPEETTRLNSKWLSQWKVHSVATQRVPRTAVKGGWNKIVASSWEKFCSCFVRLKINCTTGLSLTPPLPQEINATKRHILNRRELKSYLEQTEQMGQEPLEVPVSHSLQNLCSFPFSQATSQCWMCPPLYREGSWKTKAERWRVGVENEEAKDNWTSLLINCPCQMPAKMRCPSGPFLRRVDTSPVQVI